MRFLSLSLQHFMAFRQRQELPLADQGLVLIRGENRVSGAADSNGAGKSSLVSALSWCLFGQTLNGLRADDVANRFTDKSCVVDLTLDVDGITWRITRSRRPAELRVWRDRDGKTVTSADARETQERIEQLVGFGFDTFRHAMVFGQQTVERFANADQASKLKMLDEIQGLDFRSALDRAKAWRAEWERRQQEAETEAKRVQDRQQLAAKQIDVLAAAKEQFSRRKAERGQELGDRVASWRRRLEQLVVEEQQLRTAALKAAELRRRWTHLQEAQQAVQRAKERALLVAKDREAAARELARLRQQVDSLLKADQCPTCRRSLTGKAAVQVREEFAPDDAAAERRLRSAEAKERSAAVEWDKAKQAAQVISGQHAGLTERAAAEAEAAAGPVAAKRIQEQRAMAEHEQAAAEKELTAEQARVWEGADALRAAEREEQAAAEMLETLERERRKGENTVKAAVYWCEAFGDRGIRSLLFDSVADYLNERLAAHLAVLTAGEAQVRLSALSALKSGATRERLSIGVEWGWGAGSYAAGSGGQSRRVDLALFAALQDLAESRSARRFPFKVWDEAGDSLDATGKEVFIQWVRNQAYERGSGFLITHDNEMASMVIPDRTWTVVLDRDGSRVEMT